MNERTEYWLRYGCGGKLIAILLMPFILLIAFSINGLFKKSSEPEKYYKEAYQKVDYFFPELDTIIIFRTKDGDNPIIKKYAKYSLSWRDSIYKDLSAETFMTPSRGIFDDLIDGTYENLEKFNPNNNSKVGIRIQRYTSAESLERNLNIKLGHLQEAKRVIEDKEVYPWDGKTKYLSLIHI